MNIKDKTEEWDMRDREAEVIEPPPQTTLNEADIEKMAAKAQFLRYHHRVQELQRVVVREAQLVGAPPQVIGQVMAATLSNSNANAMAQLLIAKGVISELEYGKAMADGIDQSIKETEERYTQLLKQQVQANPSPIIKP